MFRKSLLASTLALFAAVTVAAAPGPRDNCPGGQCPVQPPQSLKLFDRFHRGDNNIPRANETPTLDPTLAVVSVMIPNVASGVVVYVEDGQALVITAQHCISDGKYDGEVSIRFTSGKVVQGRVVRVQNTGDDLAAILIPADDATRAIAVATVAPLVGTTVTQCGYTGAEPGKGPYQRYGTVEKTDGPFMYLSMSVDGGDSGSGVFDASKQLIGITVRKQSSRGPGKAMAYEFARLRRFYDQCVRELFPNRAKGPAVPAVPPVVPPAVPLNPQGTTPAQPSPAVPPVPAAPSLTRDEVRTLAGIDDLEKNIGTIITLVQLLLGGGGAAAAVPLILTLLKMWKQYKAGAAAGKPAAVAVQQVVRRRRKRKEATV